MKALCHFGQKISPHAFTLLKSFLAGTMADFFWMCMACDSNRLLKCYCDANNFAQISVQIGFTERNLISQKHILPILNAWPYGCGNFTFRLNFKSLTFLHWHFDSKGSEKYHHQAGAQTTKPMARLLHQKWFPFAFLEFR